MAASPKPEPLKIFISHSTDDLEAARRVYRVLGSQRQVRLEIDRAELSSGSDWSPGFLQQLRAVDPETVEAVDDLLASVRQARTAKPPREL